jgi:hypothetical protein
MNCQEFEQTVIGLAEGQLMDAALRARGMAHAAECARCSRRWQDEQVLSAGLRAFAVSTANAEAPARLKAALRAAFDEQAKPVAPSVVVPFRSRAPRWPRWALAAAAAVLVMLGVAALIWLRGVAPQSQQLTAGPTTSPSSTVTPVLPNNAPAPLAPQRKNDIAQRNAPKPANRPRRFVPPAPQPEPVPTHAAETEVTEVAAQFIPLNYARGVSQDGLVVRVEVSRANLIAMGLPLDALRTEGNVKADLKVGMNGVPLAIRLLQ